uniref:PDZ domain-containing protein n=1 Tax=Steinernema glaseri TaxID=37863 RepID=A0A1I7YJW3_9BILA
MTESLKVSVDEIEHFGAHFNEQMVVIYVHHCGAVDGRLKVGDRIVKLNNKAVPDRTAFNKIYGHRPITKIDVERDDKRGKDIAVEMQIPTTLKYTRRPGYAYLVVNLAVRPNGPNLGLRVKNGPKGTVLVQKTIRNSLSSERLFYGDRIIYVDKEKVTDKEQLKKLLVQGLANPGGVAIAVERPDSMEAREQIAEVLTVTSHRSTRSKSRKQASKEKTGSK